jgi:NAD(P)-dependent dehydrogenase (short-subunit alcohol dehydrogenase family)
MRSFHPSGEPELLAVPGDIAEAETAQRVVELALDRFGRSDTLINNAGPFSGQPFTAYTFDEYAAVTAVLPHHPSRDPTDPVSLAGGGFVCRA